MGFLKFPEGHVPTARQKILATAHELFHLEGIQATGINRIIAEAGVTKVTFYRHFPSKDNLILAYLESRDVGWIQWFTQALEQNGGGVGALLPTLNEWFSHPEFYGCALLNGVTELGRTLPGVVEICQRHKAKVREILARALPAADNALRAEAIALALDGAIMHCQTNRSPGAALAILERVIRVFGDGQERFS